MEHQLTIYNTLDRKKELFVPLHAPHVGMYVCGPTVYGDAHLGHARPAITFDVLFRYLTHLGYKVRYVRNITDVGHLTSDADSGEDKMLKGAKREHKTVMEIAEFYRKAFFEDCAKLNIKTPDVVEPATNCIPEFIHMIEKLLDDGYAYVAGGNVYFDTSKLKEYYVLSNQKEEELMVGARDDVEEDENLERFLECPCRFLITTREDFRDYDFCQIDVQQMEDINDVEALFAVYNPRSYEEEERGEIREILKLVEYHTMTVELIAKYLREAEEEPYVLLEKMRMIEGITGTEEVSVKHRKDRKMQNQKVQEHLKALFDLSGFSNVQLELMQSLSLLGYVRIARETFLSYVPLAGAKEALDKLIRLGWVEQNRKTDKISLHQIILDLVYHDSKPTAESCPAITEKMTAYARQDLESSALDGVRWQFLKYFMERISGENLAYARLCVAYCGHIHNEMYYLKQAEEICLSMQNEKCHALLFQIYLLQIRKVGKKDDLINRMIEDEEFDESSYLEMFAEQVHDLACKAEREIQSGCWDSWEKYDRSGTGSERCTGR